MRRRTINILFVLAILLVAGCRDRSAEAPTTGTYGAAADPAPKSMPHRDDAAKGEPWTNGELAVIESKLSPASLCFSRSPALSFFAGLSGNGPGGPTFVAISTEQGPKIFKPGERIDPARMRESWFVIWFSGAQGWTNWDVPWFVTLQHRPKTIRFDTNGLHFNFTGAAGFAALMPLYGAYKPLPAGQESSPLAALKDKKKRVLTWEWHKALPADPLARARYWASVLREFPISVDESFSIDRAHDSVTIEESFRWLSWSDDWNTKPMKLAPISPLLGHAYKEAFPAGFSRKPFDMEIFTDYGPYYGIEGADSYRVTLPVLRYVHETAGVGESAGGKLDAPCFVAWQIAHGSNQWDSIAKGWPDMRAGFRARAATYWPAFASAQGRPPLDQTADALGAARIAYRLRDMDTYGVAAHSFARSLVQLSAQQRGLNYFREHQPWRSMEPIDSTAALTLMDQAGWKIGSGPTAAVIAGVPDLARILRDTLPASTERRADSAPALERLIPGSAATSFLSHDLVGSSSQGGLVQTIVAGTVSVDPEAAWPRVVWPAWPKADGLPWSFGQITISKRGLTGAEVMDLNPVSRMIILRAH